MFKAFKYRLCPTEKQSVLMNKHFGYVRFVYNWALEKKIKAYEIDKTRLSYFDLTADLLNLKVQYPWLLEANTQSLQASVKNIENAFTAFFKQKNRFPKFKSKHKSRLSCQYPQSIKVNFDTNEVSFPKLGKVKAILHRKFSGKIKTCTLTKTPTQKYFVSILVEDTSTFPSKFSISEDTTIGIDVGLKHFATFSDGSKINNPKLLSKSEKLLIKLQRRLSKKQKGSSNRQDAKLLVAKHYEKVTNQRNYFLHKLTHELVCESQTTMFACEDLNVEGMMKNHHLAKAISDVGWSRFNSFLAYKCDWYGKTYIQIGRFDASSKICSVCGTTNQNLTLKDRTWICPSCNTTHDRDINAAINIKKFGYIRSCGTTSELKQSFSERLGSLT